MASIFQESGELSERFLVHMRVDPDSLKMIAIDLDFLLQVRRFLDTHLRNATSHCEARASCDGLHSRYGCFQK